MKNIFKSFSTVVAIAVAAFAGTGCEGFLDANSSTATDDTIVLSNTSNLDKVLVGTYNGLLMGNTVSSSDRGLAGLTGMMSYYPLAGVDMTSLKGMGTSEHTSYTFADVFAKDKSSYLSDVFFNVSPFTFFTSV